MASSAHFIRPAVLVAAALACVVTAVLVLFAPGPAAVASSVPGPTTTAPTSVPATHPPTSGPPVPPPTSAPVAIEPAAAADADGRLRRGEHGPAVLVLQQRLEALGFWLGSPDGGYGALTEQAVLAFQKAHGLARDGVAGPSTLTALAGARPEPRSTVDGLEIDLERQLLLVVRGGEVRWVLNTSTGAAATPTPAGQFIVDRAIDGVRHAPLGDLYRPRYFNGGIAVHGSNSIPGHTASPGCARVSNGAMDMLWLSDLAAIGTPVRVY